MPVFEISMPVVFRLIAGNEQEVLKKFKQYMSSDDFTISEIIEEGDEI